MESVDCPISAFALYRTASQVDADALLKTRIGLLKLDRGRLIMEDQRAALHVYTLQSGWAYSYVLLSDGRRQILDFFHPGDFLTMSSLFGQGLRASVRCLTAVELCQFDKIELRSLFMDSNSMREGLCEYVGVQKRECDVRMIQLGILSAEEAVASLILEFAEATTKRGSDANEFPFLLRNYRDSRRPRCQRP